MIKSLKIVAHWLERINSVFLFVCRELIILIVAMIAVILIASVVFRYGFDNALSWAEESSKYLMVWLTFLGAPIALRQFAHINIDLIFKVLPARAQQVLYLVVSVIICVTMYVVFITGVAFTEMGARQVASSFNVSMLYMYIAVPIGSGLTFLVAVEQALLSLIGISNPDEGLIVSDELPDSAV